MTTKARAVHSVDTVKQLDNAESNLHSRSVIRLRDIVDGLSRQVKDDTHDLHEIQDERAELQSAHARFLELAELSRPKQERLEIAAGLLLNLRKRPSALANEIRSPGKSDEEDLLLVSSEKFDPAKAPLWKVIREILRQGSEMRIVELERALNLFGLKTARQSIDSALATHRKDFKITRQGREKYVSLN